MLKVLRIFLFLTVLRNIQGATKIPLSGIEYPWIIGASRCSITDYPFVVSIRKLPSYEHICGGSLILPSWILTSTTCVKEFSKNRLLVTAGCECLQANLSKTDRKNSARVAKVVMHSNPELHNIAVIQLTRRLKESLNINFVKLANYLNSIDNLYFAGCTNSTILGWGYVLNSTEDIGKKRYLDEPSCLHCITFSMAGHFSKRKLIKANNSISYRNAKQAEYCQGDSGGPLMCNKIQIGIVKMGCSNAGAESFYTRVDNHMQFIYKSIRSAGSHFYFHFPYFVIVFLLIQ